jgi:ketosteroid isomerase-like protein
MQRARLSFWRRVGIVLALIWMVVGGSWGWRHAYDKADAEFRTCIAAVKTVPDVQACRDTRFSAIAVPRGVSATIVALAPLAAIWLFIYGVLWLARRVRRVFSAEPRRAAAVDPPQSAADTEPTVTQASPGSVPAALASGPVAIGLPTRPNPVVAPEVGTSANKRTVERYMDGFRRSDHQLILSCLTDDVEWVIPGMFHVQGKGAFDKEIENEACIGSPVITVTRLAEENDVVVAEGSVHAARRDGGSLNAVFCDVFEMRDAKIRRLTSYLMEIKAP